VELTLESVLAQTQRPVSWVIVDDGSRDRCPSIVESYAGRYGFIRLVRVPRTGPRAPGGGVIEAFDRGLAAVSPSCDFQFLCKLDCDLSFSPPYFESLIQHMEKDESLGIASGVYLECDDRGSWQVVSMPSYHAFGACKMVRRRCFREIGGFVRARGWDTVDEIRAMSKGWKTGHYEALRVFHHKREGSGIGLLRTGSLHGEVFYTTGGDPLFFLLKCIHRLRTRPVLLGAAALVWGYARAALTQKARLVSAEEARLYRTLLRMRLRGAALSGPPLSKGHRRR
jgi:poly-beta-1,6-N-acetyl-D-glucosamine synthase